MKIAITTSQANMASGLDNRFGRAIHIMIYDSETKQAQPLERNEPPTHSAGIKTAQDIVNAGVEAVITGHVGPNAFQVLSAANIQVFTSTAASAQEAVELYQKGELTSLAQPDKTGHWA